MLASECTLREMQGPASGVSCNVTRPCEMWSGVWVTPSPARGCVMSSCLREWILMALVPRQHFLQCVCEQVRCTVGSP